MFEHGTLLVLVVAVAAGLVTATVSALKVRSRRTAFFRYFLAQILLFNLLVLGGLVLQYVRMQTGPGAADSAPIRWPVSLAALAVLKLGWLYAFTAMTLVLPRRQLPDRFRTRFGTGAVVFYAVWALLLAVGLLVRAGGAAGGILGTMEVVVVGGAAVAAARLLVRSRTLPPGSERGAVSRLAALYLAQFVVVLVSMVAGWLRSPGGGTGRVLFHGVLLAVYNLLPLAWVGRIGPLDGPASASDLEEYGITPREREVIDLICEGRTNREIADRLFISLATVKDHNYNIFRKTGVRNRVELVNLMRERAVSGSS